MKNIASPLNKMRWFSGATLAVSVMIKILEHNTSTATTVPPQPIPSPVALVLNYAALDFNFTSWMSPANLHVLRSEQSSGNLPGIKELAMQKDHLGHVSPLSMVGDKRPSRHGKNKLKRQSSWRDTIRGLTNSGEEDKEVPRLKSRHTAMEQTTSMPGSSSRILIGRRERARTLPYAEDGGVLADAESDDQEPSESDFKHLREEDRPIQARVRHIYPQTSPQSNSPLPATLSTLEKQQEQLSAAIAEANSMASISPSDKKEKGKGEPIGTRLTMTSRSGYFQDRVISPSMVRLVLVLVGFVLRVYLLQMRAMAILYIGPHRNPDFATDYHISPILAPSHLLAQFPPLLMQCGEKDPFVDDTVIFAGRIREAKRARKVELDLAIAGKSARFGEGLRMSVANSVPAEGARLVAMKKERDKLARETEEDWVQMVLFSEWSHGYLQMPTLMSEAKAVIEDLGDWIDEAFRRSSAEWQRKAEERQPLALTDNRTSSPPSSSTSRSPSPLSSETETDSSVITFVPKKLRSLSHAGGGTNNPVSGSDETLREQKSGDVIENGGPLHGTPPPSWGTKTGQTISETELMRRRRLLDSHIFD